MNIEEKRKLLYYMIEKAKKIQAGIYWEDCAIVYVLEAPAITINVKEYRSQGPAWDLHIIYLGKKHQIYVKADGFQYDILEQTDNNFWSVFDNVMIKMLLE